MRNRRSNAVITVEASIAFTVFTIVFLTILFLIRIVYVYGLVQHQINMAAKEIAAYSYIYGVTVMDIDDNIQNNAAAGGEYFNTNVGNIVDGIDSIISLSDTSYSAVDSASDFDIESFIESAQSSGSSYSDLKEELPDAADSIQSIISNPKKMLQSIGSIFLGEASNDIKAFLGGEVVRAMMSGYLTEMNKAGGTSYSASERLEKLGVVGGLSGIDFSQSVFNGTVDGQPHSIDIVACYKIKPVSPISIYKELGFINRVTVRMWVGSDD